ncbi:MAG: hypothetical protein ABJA35_12085, partial [Parafilimonas sp.]
MKIKNLATFLLFILFSCNNINTKSTDESKSAINDSLGNLEELEKSASASKKITDTILLDYRFGMTKEQVLNHTQKLYA